MVIGISGKINSGKDTVGEIIRYLISYQINGGNWSYPNGFKSNIQYTESKWEIKKFADKLKDIVCLLIGCTREQLEDRGFKETPLGEEWRNLFDKNDKITLHKDLEGYSSVLTPRKLLQLLGTECGREIIHPNIWVNALMSECKPFIKGYPQLTNSAGKELIEGENYSMGKAILPNWIITDMRFPNELKAVKDKGGITIRVNRDRGLVGEADKGRFDVTKEGLVPSKNNPNHPSETALDNTEFDFVIDNNGTIGDLVEKVKEILIKEKLI